MKYGIFLSQDTPKNASSECWPTDLAAVTWWMRISRQKMQISFHKTFRRQRLLEMRISGEKSREINASLNCKHCRVRTLSELPCSSWSPIRTIVILPWKIVFVENRCADGIRRNDSLLDVIFPSCDNYAHEHKTRLTRCHIEVTKLSFSRRPHASRHRNDMNHISFVTPGWLWPQHAINCL